MLPKSFIGEVKVKSRLITANNNNALMTILIAEWRLMFVKFIALSFTLILQAKQLLEDFQRKVNRG